MEVYQEAIGAKVEHRLLWVIDRSKHEKYLKRIQNTFSLKKDEQTRVKIGSKQG